MVPPPSNGMGLRVSWSPPPPPARVWVGVTTVSVPNLANQTIAPPPPIEYVNPASDQSMIDPDSYGYNAVYARPGYDLVFSDEFNGSNFI